MQVRTLAARFAAFDDIRELSALFAGSTYLKPEEQEAIEGEAGSTLGFSPASDYGRVWHREPLPKSPSISATIIGRHLAG